MPSEWTHDLPFEQSGSELPLVLAGRYELGETLGLGGSGEVRRAWDRRLQRAVAVKLFAPGVHGPDRRRQGQELQTLARLCHPGLVELHDAGRDGGRGFLVMRLVEGPSLAELVARGPLPPLTVATLGAQLADALAYVHDAGVTHRDLKPDNVLLDEQGRPLLADFGIALLVDSTRVTVAGGVVGTAAYMAPEQVRGEPVGAAADVYALGLVLLEALRGEREFPGTTHETVFARLHRAPRVPNDLPGDLTALLRAMTASDPVERPEAAVIAARLRAVVLALEPDTVPVETVLAGPAVSGSSSATAIRAAAEPYEGPPTSPSALDALFAEPDPRPTAASRASGAGAIGAVSMRRPRHRVVVAASIAGVLAAAGVGAATLGITSGSGTAGATAPPQAAAAVALPGPAMPGPSSDPTVTAPRAVVGTVAPSTADPTAATAARARAISNGAGGLPGAVARPARASTGAAGAPSATSGPDRSREHHGSARTSTRNQEPDQPSSGSSGGPRDDGSSGGAHDGGPSGGSGDKGPTKGSHDSGSSGGSYDDGSPDDHAGRGGSSRDNGGSSRDHGGGSSSGSDDFGHDG